MKRSRRVVLTLMAGAASDVVPTQMVRHHPCRVHSHSGR